MYGHTSFTMRTCKKCGITKPIEEFAKNTFCNYGRTHTCKVCFNAYQRKRESNDIDTHRCTKRKWYQRIKDGVIAAYGGKCVCCGESTRVFLALDHVNGGGRRERLTKSTGGNFAYVDAKRRNYPPDYQVLCFNCNWAKHVLGSCPHQTK